MGPSVKNVLVASVFSPGGGHSQLQGHLQEGVASTEDCGKICAGWQESVTALGLAWGHWGGLTPR